MLYIWPIKKDKISLTFEKFKSILLMFLNSKWVVGGKGVVLKLRISQREWWLFQVRVVISDSFEEHVLSPSLQPIDLWWTKDWIEISIVQTSETQENSNSTIYNSFIYSSLFWFHECVILCIMYNFYNLLCHRLVYIFVRFNLLQKRDSFFRIYYQFTHNELYYIKIWYQIIFQVLRPFVFRQSIYFMLSLNNWKNNDRKNKNRINNTKFLV